MPGWEQEGMMVTRFDRFAACALLAAFVCTTPAPAGIIRWDGEGADDRFVTALNWSGDMVPMPTDGASYPIPDTIVFDAIDFTHPTLGATVTNDVVFDLPFFGSTYLVAKPNIDTPALGVTGMLTVTGSGRLLTTDTIIESSGSTALVRVR